ncbi:hypothetical protein pipiens_001399 [Culex pipiens pipiens]|uniref:Uncharacterized protein n=1 Tax=Culex pipiens pipiens TaxID=38569 RepID=A0ABD1CX91_CULPP
MPVAVRLVEFLTIVTLFFLVSTGAFLLYFADKIVYAIGIIFTPIKEFVQLILIIMEYFFYWSTKNLLNLVTSLASCGGTEIAQPEQG